jgi:hypothetical protein
MRPTFPVVVFPQVYDLPLGFWQWCKLREVCNVVSNVALLADVRFSPTPQDLVNNFAGLVRMNHLPATAEVFNRDVTNQKIFRYSMNGMLFGMNVPEDLPDLPPYSWFTLRLMTREMDQVFVPKGWVIDTLKAIRFGAVAATEFTKQGGVRIGFRPAIDSRGHFHIDGPFKSISIPIPDCVR